MTDDLVFSDEAAPTVHKPVPAPWQVLIIDDEPGVHEVTRLVLADFQMDGRQLALLHCYTAAQARELLARRHDVALILLDVVMEEPSAGLDLVRFIRHDLHNLNVRIVLRTGQAGQAPEEQVIRDYDINDYKEKTELTRRKLITVFYAGLRAYRDLMRIEQARAGLRRSIEAITRVCDSQSLRNFASAVLEQLNFLLDLNGDGVCAGRTSAYSASQTGGELKVLAATEAFTSLLQGEQLACLPPHVQIALQRAVTEKASHYSERHFAVYHRTQSGSESVIYMQFFQCISTQARELLELFATNVAITYDNLLLREETELTQANTIILLGDALEQRSHLGSGHAHRVGAIAALLAQRSGWNERETARFRQAAALHDVGKAAISDAVLTKPGALRDDEWVLVKTHCRKGHDLLAGSPCAVHQMAAQVALQHHERWDGSGYPAGLHGEQISAHARMTCVAEVFDALASPTCYRAAWPLAQVFDYLQEHAGSQFDPALVTLLLAERTAVEALYQPV